MDKQKAPDVGYFTALNKAADEGDEGARTMLKFYNNVADKRDAEAARRDAEAARSDDEVTPDESDEVNIDRSTVAATNGDPEAQYKLANKYFHGDGVTKDYSEAIKWFRLSAEYGHEFAQLMMGVMYRYGYGVPKDLEESKKWFRLSADHINHQFD